MTAKAFIPLACALALVLAAASVAKGARVRQDQGRRARLVARRPEERRGRQRAARRRMPPRRQSLIRRNRQRVAPERGRRRNPRKVPALTRAGRLSSGTGQGKPAPKRPKPEHWRPRIKHSTTCSESLGRARTSRRRRTVRKTRGPAQAMVPKNRRVAQGGRQAWGQRQGDRRPARGARRPKAEASSRRRRTAERPRR